jgi:hypothetical protein
MANAPHLDATAEARFWEGLEATGRFSWERPGVDIDIVLAGDYPRDVKPKAVSFPDPATAARRGGRLALLPLPRLLELKLASGMTAAHRLRDLADVQEVIRILGLPQSFAGEMNASVRDKYIELWETVQGVPPE